jgi:hypothetical protein
MASAAVAVCLAASLPAAAQAYYTINGQPAPYNIALYMASNNLPPGNYWVDSHGWWGIVGNPRPLGNIYAASTQPPRPGLSQRGRLYYPGEILNGH